MFSPGCRVPYQNFKGRSAWISYRTDLAGLDGPSFVRKYNWQCNLKVAKESRSVSSHAQDLRKVIEDRIGPLSTRPTVPVSDPLVVIISGPSGVGKDAVIKSLRQARPDLSFVVTATSRSVRPGELDGKDYFFVSKEQFETWLSQGDLLEHAVVYGEYKGIPRTQVEQARERGSDVVLRIDVQGAETIRKLMPECVCIFLVADSEAELVERLIARKTEPVDSMLVRIQTARNECTHINRFDYIVVNKEGQLEDTVSAISAIIDAEKLSVRRRRVVAGSDSQ